MMNTQERSLYKEGRGVTVKETVVLILIQNIHCSYSLELPHGGHSDEHRQSMFRKKKKKENTNGYQLKTDIHGAMKASIIPP